MTFPRRLHNLFLLCLLLLGSFPPAQADIDCDGVDDLLTTGLLLSAFVTDSTFSVTTWVKVQSTPATGTNCYEGSVLTGEAYGVLSLGRRAPTTFCVEAYDASSRHLSGTASPGWHHLAVTAGGGLLTFYVDGIVSETDGLTALSDLTAPVTLCGIPSGFTADRLADVRYCPTALPAAEILLMAASRQRGIGRTPASAAWPLDDCAHGSSGDGISFKDRSGNNRHATGTNGGGTCRGSEYLMRTGWVQ